MDHVRRGIHQLGQFEVTLVQETVPTTTYMVQVTNELNRTYFDCPRWRELTELYGMEVRTKCHFYLDNAFDTIHFVYMSREELRSKHY
jgi:hypothetical protein